MWFRGDKSKRANPLAAFPPVPCIEEAVALVAQQRGRKIKLLPWDLGPGTLSGLWVVCESVDYIVHPADALPTRRTAIIAHELAHMLLNHEPQSSVGGAEQIAKALAPTLDSRVVRRLLARHAEDSPDEAAAERLGTEILARLSLAASSSPQDPMLGRLLA